MRGGFANSVRHHLKGLANVDDKCPRDFRYINPSARFVEDL